MLNRLLTLTLTLAALGSATLGLSGCGGAGGDLLANPFFDYSPKFASYTGGEGNTANPAAGVWKLEFQASTGSVLQATTIHGVCFGNTATNALLFVLSPSRRSNLYGDITMNGNDITIRFHEYEPRQNRTLEIFGEGTIVGDGVTDGQYEVERKTDGSGATSGDGFWTLTIAPLDPPEFAAITNGTITDLQVLMVDENGRGNNELFGSFDLTVAGNTVTGTITCATANEEGQGVGTGTIEIDGTLDPATSIITCNLAGTVGTVNCGGTAIITIAAVDTSSTFTVSDIPTGTFTINFGNNTSAFLANRDFKGTVSRSTGSGF